MTRVFYTCGAAINFINMTLGYKDPRSLVFTVSALLFVFCSLRALKPGKFEDEKTDD